MKLGVQRRYESCSSAQKQLQRRIPISPELTLALAFTNGIPFILLAAISHILTFMFSSTSICSFEPFYTLAFDVSCGHIPNFLTSGCQKSSSTWIAAASEDSNTIADEVLTCGWYLKSKSNNHNHLMSGYALDSKNGSVTDILGSRAFPSWDVPLNWVRSYLTA